MRRLDIALRAANTRFDLRVAFRLLVFLLDLRQAHLDGLLKFVLLIREVCDSQNQQDNADAQAERPDEIADGSNNFGQGHPHGPKQIARFHRMTSVE